jgi:uncharacterized protein YwgA
MYHYGPYSPALAEDYYSDTFAATATNESLLSVVDTDSFFELVSGRSRQWLEVAATIKSLNAKYGRSEAGGKSHVVERTSTLKDVSPDGADRIYTELESFGVV